MKVRAWTSIVGGGLLSLAAISCSASSTGDKGDNGATSTGSTSSGSSGSLMLGGNVGAGGSVTLGGSTGSGASAGACQAGGVEFVPKIPTVLMMVDRSGTMFNQQGDNPWTTLRDGVLPVVQQLDAQVRFGFIAITGEMSGMCPMIDEVAPADNGYAAVAAKYMSLTRPAVGESPGMLGLQRAHELLKADTTEGEKYVLFVTDGEQDYCGNGNPLCPTDSVVYWLQKLKTDGVHTFIFGLPANISGSIPYDVTLQAFANAGAGEPTLPALGTGMTIQQIYDQCFYGGDMNAAGWKTEFATAAKVDDVATVDIDESKTLGNYSATGGTAKVFKPDPTDQAALTEQFRAVLAGVKSCTFDLGGDIKVVQDLLSEAHVYVEGQEVPLDLTKTNGWHMPTPTQIELVGEACANWRMPMNNKIDWDFPCKILVPK
jgi:hypothetical protein